jgi:ribosome maturation factor RimP
MEYNTKHSGSALAGEIDPVVNGLGYALLDLSQQKAAGRQQIQLIITKSGGGKVGLKDCEMVHRTIMPRLELVLDDRDLHIEVSSPGISRNIKSGSEFAHFPGARVRLLLADQSDWLEGELLESDDKGLSLRSKSGERTISYNEIRKAKLVDTQEEKL